MFFGSFYYIWAQNTHNMQNISLFHESFNLRKLSSYLLNIQVSEEGLFYTINDSVRKQCIAVVANEYENKAESLIDKFQIIVKSDVYLNKHYKAVNFFLVSDKLTLVPADFFDKKSFREKLERIIDNKRDEKRVKDLIIELRVAREFLTLLNSSHKCITG